MNTDLMTRAELLAHFKISRSTLHTYTRHYPDFPPARGMKGRFALYQLGEVKAFFEAHAPQHAAKAEG